tara:strand:- start:1911 stop:2180 length:270 start_codon:yes stop_codon:yes gene_type:complete
MSTLKYTADQLRRWEAKERADGTVHYRVTLKVDGQLPDDPYFEGQTGNAYPDFTCTVWAPDEWKARTRAMFRYPNQLRGERVRYEIEEV